MEDVDDEVDEIQQNPPGSVKPLHMKWPVAFLRHLLHDVLGDGPDLNVRGPSGKQEKVGRRRNAPQIQRHHSLGFSIKGKFGGLRNLPGEILREAIQPSSRSTVTSITVSTSA